MAKRKAAEVANSDSYDSDEIQLAPTSSSRRALRNVSVPNVQNKRRRIAECVLLPNSRESRKLLSDQQCFTAQPRAQLSTQSSAVSDSGSDVVEIEAFPTASSSASSSPRRLHAQHRIERAAISPKRTSPTSFTLRAIPHTGDNSNVRARRSKPRVSYASMVEPSDDSADELSFAAPALGSKRKQQKKAASVSSEYEDDVDATLEEVEDDYRSNKDVSDQYDDIFGSTVDAHPPVKKKKSASTAVLANADGTESKKASKEMKNLIDLTAKGLDLSLPPLHNIDDIFLDLTQRALSLGLEDAVRSLQNKRLRVATMCSGTESPLLAIEMIQNALKSSVGVTFDIEHLFSAEIHEVKQAYIERNFAPPVIFRDITELVDVAGVPNAQAKTAYSGMAPVPTDVDIVIAGTSCVDYSNMNKHQKGIKDGGESGDTWYAVLAYCRAYRPAIVVLENVKNAKWDIMLQDYKDLGYEPVGAYVDTKDFYLPQTRQRGYMVCFDTARLQAAGVSSAGDDWKMLMEALQRRASSPVSSFLLPSSQMTARPLQINVNDRDVDWSLCELRQMGYRLKERLGVNRPITHWSENGSVNPPDYSSRAWHRNQVERVLDTLDAATLRRASEGYDARFKTRIWDVSQNVDRINENKHFGVVGCITPSGINFVSDSWRAMTPHECLLLQGIPLKKISLTVETNVHIQDLAGNAMSAPLVGTAIISSLIAGYKIFDSRKESVLKNEHTARDAVELVSTEARSASATSDRKHVDIACLHKDVERVLRRCYCEGGHGHSNHSIQQCVDCGHTTCIACGGNPEHHYRQSQQLTLGRASFTTFEQNLRSKLPLRLKLSDAPRWSAKGSSSNYYRLVHPLGMSIFSLSSILRTHCIRVIYTAPEGRLELCVTEGRASWHLFANAPADLPSNAFLRLSLAQPVARSQVGASLLDNQWEWRQPDEGNAKVTITGKGEKLPAWRARMQMPEFRNEWQWQLLEVDAAALGQDINGTYQLLPHCGTANESLYKRVNRSTERPLYLFLDPTRVGPANEDCFVFAHDHSRLDYDESRQALARVDAKWRPWPKKGEESVDPHTTIKYWQWSRASNTVLTAEDADLVLHRSADMALATKDLTCQQVLVTVSASGTAVPSKTSLLQRDHGLVELDDQHFFSKTAWIFEAMRRQLPTDEWIEVSMPMPSTCYDCAPKMPSLKWELANNGKIRPYEDPHTATIYERTIKNQQSPILVQLDKGLLSFGVNLVSLAHRARSRLPIEDGQVSYQWKLTTSPPKDVLLKQFRLSPTQNVQPAEEDASMSVKLFPKQRLALAWMRAQETDLGKPVVLEEAEEASLPQLGWRVEMRAQATQYVKGGICADHPGFGKTITSLTLVHTEWLRHGSKALKARLGQSQALDTTGDLLMSSATVIVCPRLLIDQWYKEACEKWKSKDKICKIKNANELANFTIEDFTSAKLILISRQALASGSYTDRLAAFAAVPGPSQEKGRPNAAWLQYAAEQVPEHLKILTASGKPALVKHLKAKYQENLDSEDFVRDVPSKRQKGRHYTAAKAKANDEVATMSDSKPAKRSTEALRTELVGSPLLEQFVFNRIIVDEFHECDAKELEIVASIKADKRWGLSGTPALSDCYDIAQIGKLLNVSLRMGSIQKGFMKHRNIISLNRDMTSFEKFEAARVTPSNSQNERIQELAQEFLDTFARRNVMDFDELSVQQHLVPTILSLGHQATYHELSQHLNSSDMKIKKSQKKDKTDRQQQLEDAIERSQSAEEALSKSAAYPRLADANASLQLILEGWIRRRENESEQRIKELRPAIQKAYTKEPEAYFSWREARIDTNVIKDKETAAIVKDQCRKIDSGKTSASLTKRAKVDGTILRDATGLANQLVTRLLTSKRSARYLLNVTLIQDLALETKDRHRQCDDPDCQSDLSADDPLAVSGFCGHLVCGDCWQRARAKNVAECAADGCGEAMVSHHLLWNYKLGDTANRTHPPHGAKIEAALDILDDIRAKKDQAVLFVQYDHQLLAVEQALEERGIPAVVIHSTNAAAEKIESFTKDKSKKTVIVLNATSEAAAGLNLQNANRIIFLSPLLRDTQYAYDSTMAQAIGRVRRHGQTKKIHVYRVLALNTIDVDILEHRERRVDALTEQNAPTISPPPAAKLLAMHASKPQAERTQLVRDEEGRFALRPQSWLVRCGADEEGEDEEEAWRKVKGMRRVGGWEDFSSLVKFSRGFTEDDD